MCCEYYTNVGWCKKGKGSPYSITELMVPELIPVLGSQPTGDVSHKPGSRLPLLSARPAVTPATLKRAATNIAAWMMASVKRNVTDWHYMLMLCYNMLHTGGTLSTRPDDCQISSRHKGRPLSTRRVAWTVPRLLSAVSWCCPLKQEF